MSVGQMYITITNKYVCHHFHGIFTGISCPRLELIYTLLGKRAEILNTYYLSIISIRPASEITMYMSLDIGAGYPVRV